MADNSAILNMIKSIFKKVDIELEEPMIYSPKIERKVKPVKDLYDWMNDHIDELNIYYIYTDYAVSIHDTGDVRHIDISIYNWMLLLCAEVLVQILCDYSQCIEHLEFNLCRQCRIIRRLDSGCYGTTIYPVYKRYDIVYNLLDVVGWRKLVAVGTFGVENIVELIRNRLIQFHDELIAAHC